jgi:hypothetical protein
MGFSLSLLKVGHRTYSLHSPTRCAWQAGTCMKRQRPLLLKSSLAQRLVQSRHFCPSLSFLLAASPSLLSISQRISLPIFGDEIRGAGDCFTGSYHAAEHRQPLQNACSYQPPHCIFCRKQSTSNVLRPKIPLFLRMCDQVQTGRDIAEKIGQEDLWSKTNWIGPPSDARACIRVGACSK